MADKLITVREASKELGISEKELIDLAEQEKIPSYKIGGEFLRFRKDDLFDVKNEVKQILNVVDDKIGFGELIYDFFYFNDFYIVSFLIMAVLAAAIIFY